jgi:hypothetical protein
MGLSFHCPKCRAAVPALPTQMGQQVTCPACQTPFRLSPAMLGGNGQSGAPKPAAAPVAAAAAPVPPPIVSHPAMAPGKTTVAEMVAKAATARWIGPAAAPLPPAPAHAQPTPSGASVAPPPIVASAALARPAPAPAAVPIAARPVAPAPSPIAPTPPPSRPNVARFISAESKDSTVQLTAEGKLPELALAEATGRKPKTSESSASPLVLGLALCASTIVSLLVVVYDFDGGKTTQQIDAARAQLERFYVTESGPLRPYQILLRDAKRAHSHGNLALEHQNYRKVLDLLRSEARGQFTFLTGSKSEDEELQSLLGEILDEEGR